MDWIYIGNFIQASVRAATPLVFGSLGVVIAERSGTRHISNEGTMLLAALTGVIGTKYFGNMAFGVLFSLVIGAVCGLILAIMMIWLPSNQTIVGIGFNMTMVGVTSYILRLGGDMLRSPVPAPAVKVLRFSLFDVFAIASALLVWFFLFRTGPGLKLRSVGENAMAADAAGINVIKTRTIAMVIACMFSSLGGMALSLSWVHVFTDNLTMGRGFIAMAAVYFGKWNPLLTTLAAFMFGGAEALALRSQALSATISSYYFLMIPYVLTLIVVAISGRMKGPQDTGKSYIRQ
ncbi:MAG: ABC transporter permease [Bacillota bacterium]|nr:ABC transporter permease [Bacillota bacterium]MDD3851541.1 ABC transporter permease [Bacillota bacterium]